MFATATDSAPTSAATVGRLASGLGVLYLGLYTAYVLTGWGPSMLLPPLAYLGYLLWRNPFGGGRPTWRLDLRYVMVLPGGVVLVEGLLVLSQAVVFTAFGFLSPVAWYPRRWLNTVGYVGPVPFLGYTLLTVALVPVAAIGIRAVRTGRTSTSLGDR